MTAWDALRRCLGLGGMTCVAHRAVLVDLLDERAADGRPAADRSAERAVEHLGRCDACQHEMGDMVLIVAALKRLGSAARAGDGPVDGWPRLAASLAPSARRRNGRVATFAGLVAAPLVAALLVAPALHGMTAGAMRAGPAGGGAALPVGSPAVLAPEAHAAALQRALDLADVTMADLAAPVAEVAPRGPLPDGMDLAASGHRPDAVATPAAPPVAE